MKEKSALQSIDIYKDHIIEYNGTSILVMKLQDKETSLLKSIADTIMNDMSSGFIFFANVMNHKTVQFIAKSNCAVPAGEIVKKACIATGGNGGGSPTFAQGGGKDISSLDSVLESILEDIKNYG